MKRPLAILLGLGAGLTLIAAGPAHGPAESGASGIVWKAVKVPGYGAFRLHVPADWAMFAMGAPPRPVGVTLTPGGEKEKTSEIYLSFMAPRVGARAPALSAVLREVETVRDLMLPAAKVPELTIQELQGRSLSGYYFSMADRSEHPSGGWRYMTYGSGVLGGFVLTFTLYSNRDIGHQLVPTLVMLRDLEWERPALEEQAETARKAEAQIKRWEPVERSKVAGSLDLSIGLPDKDWDVWIDVHDFKVDKKKVEADRSSAVLVATHPGTRVGFSALVVRIEDKRIAPRANSGICMQLIGDQAKIPYARMGTSHEERDGMHILQFDAGPFEGVPMDQRGADAYLARDGTCINVHIYKDHFLPQDQPLFNLVLDNIRFVTRE